MEHRGNQIEDNTKVLVQWQMTRPFVAMNMKFNTKLVLDPEALVEYNIEVRYSCKLLSDRQLYISLTGNYL